MLRARAEQLFCPAPSAVNSGKVYDFTSSMTLQTNHDFNSPNTGYQFFNCQLLLCECCIQDSPVSTILVFNHRPVLLFLTCTFFSLFNVLFSSLKCFLNICYKKEQVGLRDFERTSHFKRSPCECKVDSTRRDFFTLLEV